MLSAGVGTVIMERIKMKNPVYKMLKKLSHKKNWTVSWWQYGGSISIDGKVKKIKKWSRIIVSTGSVICLFLLSGCQDRQTDDRLKELEAFRNFSNHSIVEHDKQIRDLTKKVDDFIKEYNSVPAWNNAKTKEHWSRAGR